MPSLQALIASNTKATSRWYNRLYWTPLIHSFCSPDRIQKHWEGSCVTHNIELPGKVQAEFKKRIKQFGSVQDCGKAKLNLSRCDLDDQMVLFLIEALSDTPAIARLDLSGNHITDKSAICLIRLLLMQAKMVRQTQPKDRPDAIFLSEILLLNNKTVIEQRILDDITTVSDCLHHANVKSIILRSSNNSQPFTMESVEMLCMSIMGKQIDEKKVLLAISEDKDRELDSDDLISYKAIEDLIISELVITKILNPLSESQVKQITVRPAVRQRNASRWIMSGQELGPITDTSPSADHDEEQHLELVQDSIDEKSEDFDEIYRDQIGWDSSAPFTVGRSPEGSTPARALTLTSAPPIQYEDSDSDSSNSSGSSHYRVSLYPASKIKVTSTAPAHDRTPYVLDSNGSNIDNTDETRRSDKVPDTDTDTRGERVNKIIQHNSLESPRGQLVGEDECKESSLETFVDNMSDMSGVDSSHVNTPRANLMTFVYDMTPTKEKEIEEKDKTKEKDDNADTSSEKSSDESLLSAFPVHNNVPSHTLPLNAPLFVIKKAGVVDTGQQGITNGDARVSPRYLLPLASGTSRHDTDKMEQIVGTEMGVQDKQLAPTVSVPSSPRGALPTIIEEMDTIYSLSPPKILPEESANVFLTVDQGSIDIRVDDISDRNAILGKIEEDVEESYQAVTVEAPTVALHDVEVCKLKDLFVNDKSSQMDQSAEIFSPTDMIESTLDDSGYPIPNERMSADATDMGGNEMELDSRKDLSKSLTNGRMSDMSDDSNHVQGKGLVKSMVLVLEGQTIFGIIPHDIEGTGGCSNPPADISVTSDTPRHSPSPQTNCLSPLTPSPSSRHRGITKSVVASSPSLTASLLPSPVAALSVSRTPLSLVSHSKREVVSAFRARLIANIAEKEKQALILQKDSDVDSVEASSAVAASMQPTTPSPTKAMNFSNLMQSDADWSTSISPMAQSASPQPYLQPEPSAISISSTAPYTLLPPQTHSLVSASVPAIIDRSSSDSKEERVRAFRAKLIAKRAARNSFTAACSPPISPFRDESDSNVLSPVSLGMSMASTPSINPGNAFGLPLQKALSLLQDTLPMPPPVPVPTPLPVLTPAEQVYPQAPSRKGSGIIYRSRDDDSSLFQLASAIVLPDESIDVTDVTDVTHDIPVLECSLSEKATIELGSIEDNGPQEGLCTLETALKCDPVHPTEFQPLQSPEGDHTVTTEAVIVHRDDEDDKGHGVESAACVRVKRSSAIPLPIPREKILIKEKGPNTDNPFDFVIDRSLDITPSSGRKLPPVKIDILRGPKRTPGSGPGSVSEGSIASSNSSRNASDVGPGSPYGFDDYAEYPQGDMDGLGQGTFFADDNPFSQSSSKRDSGRLCDFSGPLGEKIKESIMMNMSVESMEAYVEQRTALEGVKVGSTQSSLGSPTAAPKALSKTCPEMHPSPAPRHNPLSVSVPSLSSKPSVPSPPSSPSHSCPPERKYRSISPIVLNPATGPHAATLSASTYPPSPISRALHSEASTPMQKILSSSATSFSTFSTPNGALKGSPKVLAVVVDVEREPTVATYGEFESTAATPEKAKNTPRLEMGTRSRSGSITGSKGSNPIPVQGKLSDGPVPSRQLWTKPVPSNSNAYTNFLKSSVTKNVEVGVEVEVVVEATVEVERDIEVITNSEQCKSDGDSHVIDCKDDSGVKDRMSSTIYNPDDEKRKRNSHAALNSIDNGFNHSSTTSKGNQKANKEEKKKEKDEKEKEERNDFLLDLTDHHLTTFNASLHHLYPRSKLTLLCVLILRNNQLTDLVSMRMKEMVCVTDLDLAFNRFKGAIPHSVFPRNLERLDLEGNGFHDFSGLVTCNALKCVNISHNQINDIAALPPRVTDLDISHNQLSSPLHLRLLSLTPSIITLRITGNPIAEVSAFCRVIVCSVLPNIQQLDDVFIPGCGVRRKHLIADKGNGIPVKGGPQQRADLSQSMRSTSKALQEEKDNRRHEAHAKKMKAAGRAQDNVQRHIRVLSTTAPLGPQATELMVRRLTWVPPDKATAASFFGTSVAHSGFMSNEKAQSMKNGELAGTGARTDTRTGARAKSEMKDRTEIGRMGGNRPTSAQPASLIKSKPSLRRDSNDRLSSPARPVTASPALPEYSLRQGERYRDDRSKEGRSSDKPSRSAEDSSIKPSRSLETSSFSTFGASKCSSITRSNSAHRMSSTHPDTFKPFSRHSELPPSPGRDKRNAVLVVNKWLQDSVQELGKASVVLGLAFWITEQARIESNSGINFSAAMDSVPFLREMTAERCQGRGPRRASRGTATVSIGVTGHTSKLDKALEVVASGTSSVHGSSDRDDYLYLLAAVEAAKGNMESFTYVLTEIEKAIHLANRHRQESVKPRQILLDLRGQLEDIMCSTKGRIVNELVLAPFGCQLVWHGDQKDNMDEKITTVRLKESPGPSEQSEIEDEDGGEDEDRGEEECKGEGEYRDFTNSSTDSVTTLEMSMIPLTGSPTPSVSSKPSYTDLSQGSSQTVSPVLTVVDPVPTPAPAPVSSTAPTLSPAFASTLVPAIIPEIYTHDMLDEETIKTINALNNGFYRDSRASEKPCKASPSYGTGAPSTSSPPTPPKTPTRVSAENDTPQVVAQHMDPLIQRFRLKYGLAASPPAAVSHSEMAGHTSITQGPITTMFQTNFGRYSSPEVMKTQSPNTQGNGQSHGNGNGNGLFPPSPPPFNPSPVPPKGYLGSFVASPEVTKMQMQLKNLCTPKPIDGNSEKMRKGAGSVISELSYGARPFRSPGLSREGNINQQTAPQLALSENSSSGCSIEFLTGEHVAADLIKEEDLEKEMFGHKRKNSGHEILLGRAKPLNSPPHTCAGTLAAATSHSTPTSGSRPRIPEVSPLAMRVKDSNFLDYDDIYHNSDTAIYTTDAQAAHVSSFKKGNQIRKSMNTLKSFEGAAMTASSRLGKGVDNESDRFSSSRPFYTEFDTAPHNGRSDVTPSPNSINMRVPQSSSNAVPDASSPVLRIRPSIHISPSFGFTNSYSEPVPFGRCKSSKTLTHAPTDFNDKDKDSLDMSRKSSIAGDEMIVPSPSPSFKKTKGPITSPSAPTCPSSPAIISTLRSRILVTTPEIAKVSSLFKAASIDTCTSNPMRNSFVMPEGNSPGGPFRAMHGSPRASKNMPCFDLRFSAPPSPSPPSPCPTESPSNRLPSEYLDSSFVSVNKRRESIDRLHIEFQNQIAASATSSSARKAPAASIDIRGYNSEAAMAVKARLATPATPVRRRYSTEAVSAEIADRLRTLSEPSLPLCLVVGELV